MRFLNPHHHETRLHVKIIGPSNALKHYSLLTNSDLHNVGKHVPRD